MKRSSHEHARRYKADLLTAILVMGAPRPYLKEACNFDLLGMPRYAPRDVL
jgi:hypothetical protein